MCVIIVKQKNKPLSREVAKTSARINPHGLGIVWLDTFEVTRHKSNEYSVLLTDENKHRPYLAHFRYATIGKICPENTHPFVCGQNTDELLMMNGTIQGLGNSQMTDSEALAIALGKMQDNLGKESCPSMTADLFLSTRALVRFRYTTENYSRTEMAYGFQKPMCYRTM